MEIGTNLPLWLLNTDLARRKPGTPDAAMGCFDQCYCCPTIYIAVRTKVEVFTLHCEAYGCAFKRSLRLHSKEAIHRDVKGGGVGTLTEEILQVFLFLLLLRCLEVLLQKLFLVGEGVSVHNTHVVINFSLSLPESVDQQISRLVLRIFCHRQVVDK